MNICVFGASSNQIDKKYILSAEELGARLAKAGYGVVFGAGRSGLMGAVARGAHSQCGEIIGVIPEKLNIEGVYFEHCTQRIQTQTMHERKALMESMSNGFIALSGGFGTIEELMEVLTLKQLEYHALPIIILNIDGFYNSLLSQFERCVNDGFASKEFLSLYHVASNVDEAMDYLVRFDGETPVFPNKIRHMLSMAGDQA